LTRGRNAPGSWPGGHPALVDSFRIAEAVGYDAESRMIVMIVPTIVTLFCFIKYSPIKYSNMEALFNNYL
jgi:hypothetical protein